MQLPRLPNLPISRSKVLFGIATAAVPLAAILLVPAPLLAGKLLLPAQGGAPAVWVAVILYFQIALLLGCGWAVWLSSRHPRVQVPAMAGMALLAILGTRMAWLSTGSWTGIGGMLVSLALATLPAVILLVSVGPVTRSWLGRHGLIPPRHLVPASIAAGLAVAVLYPFLIERNVGLSDQVFFWEGLLWVLAGLTGAAGLCVVRAVPAQEPKPAVERVAYGRMAAWAGLSALAVAGMLGATHHLIAEIGSTPLAWVGPFSVYLLGFLVTFSDGWQPRFTDACLGWLAVSLAGFMLTKGVTGATAGGGVAFWLLSLTAAGSFFGHGLVRAARPAADGARFYLALAVGGVLGALFAGVVAPLLFLRPSEFIAISFVLVAIGLLRLVSRKDALTVAVVILIVGAPVVGLVWKQTRDETAGALRIRHFRDADGCLMLKSEENGLVLSSETTTLATQIVADAAARRRPTFYHTESSGVGRAIEEIQKARPAVNVAVVGIGGGTLAAYARADDTIDFWDTGSLAIRLARNFFTFIPDSRGRVRVMTADGRKGLETSTVNYDLVVVDALYGDALPACLLTREALAAYFRRLEERQGQLVIHAENRYNTPVPNRPSLLFPVIGATAHTLGWAALDVVTDIAKPADARDWDGAHTEYIIVCRPGQLKSLAAAFPAEEDGGRVKRTVTPYDPQPPGAAVLWTDDRNAALDVLDLGRFLAN